MYWLAPCPVSTSPRDLPSKALNCPAPPRTRQAWLSAQEPIGQGDEGGTEGQPSPRGSADVVPDIDLNITILCQVILPSPSLLEDQPRQIWSPQSVCPGGPSCRQPQTLSGNPHFDPKPWRFQVAVIYACSRQGRLAPALHSQSRGPFPGWFK